MSRKTPEGRVLDSIERALSDLVKSGHRIYYERRQAGGFSFKKGLPDLFVVVSGMHFEIEVKAPDGELSTAQIKWKERFSKLGVHSITVSSAEELLEMISFLEKTNILL